MRCSSRVTVYHLKRFLLGKLSVPPLYDVSYIMYNMYEICTMSCVSACLAIALNHALSFATNYFLYNNYIGGVAWF